MVSVIMPTHNGERTIEAAMRSVMEQSFRNLELVVVDDGSTDGTAEIVGRLKMSDCRIRYILQRPCAGAASARNRGIRVSHGRYVAFLDDDDLWLPGKLERQVECLESHPDTALCFTQMHYDPGSWEGTICPLSNTQYSYLAEFQSNLIPILTVIVRRECLDAVGGFSTDLVLSQDYDLWLRLGQRYAFHFMPVPTAVYTVHPDSISRDIEKMRREGLKLLGRVPTNRTLGVTRWWKRRRLAQVRYELTRLLYERGAYAESAWECLKTVATDPSIGESIWNERGSKVWRRFQPYRLLGRCVAGMVFGREKADVKNRRGGADVRECAGVAEIGGKGQ